MKKIIIILTSLSLIVINGCSSFAYFNDKLDPQATQLKNNRAQFAIERDRGNDDTLFILALSGGGSRAAYFSSQVMLALEDFKVEKTGRNFLQSVDAISSVSGGSLPAAYYAISKDPDDLTDKVVSNRVWERKTVEELMSLNYIVRWIANWFWPDNIALYWATAYDRSDIMAQTFADNLYDTSLGGVDLKFRDINEERPYIIINSTSGATSNFGESFTFTHDDFVTLGSDISQYHISRAVMASASFPAVFNYMTLYNYNNTGDGDKYLHVFDGGNVDNLGLDSARKIIVKKENEKYKNVVVLLVDAFTKPQGVPNSKYDALSGVDYAIDFNFMDSTDSLLNKVRKESINLVKELITKLGENGKKAMFYHLSFNEVSHFKNTTTLVKEYNIEKEEDVVKEVPLHDVLYTISTNFSISEEHRTAINKAVKLLVNKDNDCLKKIQALINDTGFETNDPYCTWPKQDMTFAKN